MSKNQNPSHVLVIHEGSNFIPAKFFPNTYAQELFFRTLAMDRKSVFYNMTNIKRLLSALDVRVMTYRDYVMMVVDRGLVQTRLTVEPKIWIYWLSRLQRYGASPLREFQTQLDNIDGLLTDPDHDDSEDPESSEEEVPKVPAKFKAKKSQPRDSEDDSESTDSEARLSGRGRLTRPTALSESDEEASQRVITRPKAKGKGRKPDTPASESSDESAGSESDSPPVHRVPAKLPSKAKAKKASVTVKVVPKAFLKASPANPTPAPPKASIVRFTPVQSKLLAKFRQEPVVPTWKNYLTFCRNSGAKPREIVAKEKFDLTADSYEAIDAAVPGYWIYHFLRTRTQHNWESYLGFCKEKRLKAIAIMSQRDFDYALEEFYDHMTQNLMPAKS